MEQRIAVFGPIESTYRDRWVAEMLQREFDTMDQVLYVVPNNTVADDVRSRLVQARAGWFGLQIVTFDEIVTRALDRYGNPSARIDRWTQHQMIADVLELMGDTTTWAGKPIQAWARVPGVVDTLRHHIAEAKRLMADPSVDADFRSSESAKVFGRVLRDYQQRLAEKRDVHLLDLEDTYWTAAGVLRSVGFAALEADIRAIYVDGFTDFEPHQLAVLEPLLACEQVHIRIPYPVRQLAMWPDHRRSFRRLQEWLIERHIKVQIIDEDQQDHRSMEEPEGSGLSSLRNNLFVSSAEKPLSAVITEDVQAVCARSERKQWAWVARHIKEALQTGVPPHRLAIVSPQPYQYGSVAYSALREEGVPVSTPPNIYPMHVAAIRDVLDLYRLRSDEWHRETVVRLAASSLFAHPCHVSGTLRRMARRQGIARGWGRWNDAITSAAFPDVAGWFQRVTSLLSDVPTVASTSVHAKTLANMMDRIGFDRLRAISVNSDDDEELLAYQRDVSAWTSLRKLLDRIDTSSHVTSVGMQMTVEQFLSLVQLMMENEQMPLGRRVEGVLWVHPSVLRCVTFDHVFIVDMNEGVFPAPEHPSWLLDDLRENLLEAHPWWNGSHHERETAAFQFLMCMYAAQHSVKMCCVMDTNDRLPSPFYEEVLSIVSPSNEQTRDWESFVTSSDFAPANRSWVGSTRELRDVLTIELRTFMTGDRHVSDDGGMAAFQKVLTGLDPVVGPMSRWAYVVGCAQIEEARAVGQAGPFGGWLEQPEIQYELARRYHDQAVFSVAQLNRYAECPFKFWMANVLGVQEDDEAGDELDPRGQGEVYHWVLRRLYASMPSPADEGWDECIAAQLDEWLDEALRAVSSSTPSLHAGRARAMRDRMRRRLHKWWEYERKIMSEMRLPLTPRYLEWSFGLPLSDEVSVDAASTTEPIQVGNIRLRGRVDRIDATDDGRFVVYDYKSRSAKGSQATNVDFQLPLYIAAISAKLFPAGQALGALYYAIERPMRSGLLRTDVADDLVYGKRRKTLSDEQWETHVTSAVELAENFQQRMRDGMYPVQPTVSSEHCSSQCAYRYTCRWSVARASQPEGGEVDDE